MNDQHYSEGDVVKVQTRRRIIDHAIVSVTASGALRLDDGQLFRRGEDGVYRGKWQKGPAGIDYRERIVEE